MSKMTLQTFFLEEKLNCTIKFFKIINLIIGLIQSKAEYRLLHKKTCGLIIGHSQMNKHMHVIEQQTIPYVGRA